MNYIGRFAPSPTGPLHLGSLMTAVASYLDAKHAQGEWLVRIEDLDPPREIQGATASILKTLARFGLQSDHPIVKQSDRHPLYARYLQSATDLGLTYKCYCARRDLLPYKNIHPANYCPSQHSDETTRPFSIRIKAPNRTITVNDLCQPAFSMNLAEQAGDFILLRKDGLYAYHLGVTVDDAEQHITHIVRGIDLLDSTPRQIYLQECFNFPTPQYLHLPVITHSDGAKFSKQTFAPSIEDAPIEATLVTILTTLGQCPPDNLHTKSKSDILSWGIAHWDRNRIPSQAALPIESIHHNG